MDIGILLQVVLFGYGIKRSVLAGFARSAYRDKGSPSYRGDGIGFRVVRP
jgi:formylglycine-generating enzyme required for sulfatase activity